MFAKRSIRGLHGPHAQRGHFVMALALAAALRRRIADARVHEALLLEPVERGVDGADRDIAPAARFDFAAHRGAVGVGPEAHQRQQHHLLELAEHGRRRWRGMGG